MNEIDAVKAKMKLKRHNNMSDENSNKYINNLITRIIMAVIVFFAVIIVTNLNSKAATFIKEDILKNNISFSKISNFYNKYFGKIIPIKEVGEESKTVFNEKLTYNSLEDYMDGYVLLVNDNYLTPVINSGIVAYIGEKDGYGKTIIIEGNDEIEYWYGNLDNISVSLYDYVSKGTFLGNTSDDKLYLVFKKNGEYLGYDEVME